MTTLDPETLLAALRKSRAKVKGNATWATTPLEVAKTHGIHPTEAQKLLRLLQARGDLAKGMAEDYWLFPEDAGRGAV